MAGAGAAPSPPASPSQGPLARAERFVRLTARVLEQHLFAHLFPHDYARTPHSLDFLAAEQQEDGGRPIRRRQWAPDPSSETRPMVTIEALHTLTAYGRTVD